MNNYSQYSQQPVNQRYSGTPRYNANAAWGMHTNNPQRFYNVSAVPNVNQNVKNDSAYTGQSENRSAGIESKTVPVKKDNAQSNSLFTLFGSLDSEKLLILMLLAVLYKNGADMPLMAALVYLLI